MLSFEAMCAAASQVRTVHIVYECLIMCFCCALVLKCMLFVGIVTVSYTHLTLPTNREV